MFHHFKRHNGKMWNFKKGIGDRELYVAHKGEVNTMIRGNLPMMRWETPTFLDTTPTVFSPGSLGMFGKSFQFPVS